VIKEEQQSRVHELALQRSSSSLVKARAHIRVGAKASINITQCAALILEWRAVGEIYSSAQNLTGGSSDADPSAASGRGGWKYAAALDLPFSRNYVPALGKRGRDKVHTA
jgi:hypothetical protein